MVQAARELLRLLPVHELPILHAFLWGQAFLEDRRLQGRTLGILSVVGEVVVELRLEVRRARVCLELRPCRFGRQDQAGLEVQQVKPRIRSNPLDWPSAMKRKLMASFFRRIQEKRLARHHRKNTRLDEQHEGLQSRELACD